MIEFIEIFLHMVGHNTVWTGLLIVFGGAFILCCLAFFWYALVTILVLRNRA